MEKNLPKGPFFERFVEPDIGASAANGYFPPSVPNAASATVGETTYASG